MKLYHYIGLALIASSTLGILGLVVLLLILTPRLAWARVK